MRRRGLWASAVSSPSVLVAAAWVLVYSPTGARMAAVLGEGVLAAGCSCARGLLLGALVYTHTLSLPLLSALWLIYRARALPLSPVPLCWLQPRWWL